MKLGKIKYCLAATAALGLGLVSIVGCNKAKSMVDYSAQLKLPLDYKDQDFFTQGVGEVNLLTCIDGDTAHFTPVVTTTSSLTIKVRFYGIDTPESTGRVQPYGKEASNFTKEKLKKAKESGTIVVAGVSSEYGIPSTDANGRYLACVWINEDVQNAPVSTLKNLNLMIVQEGYSDVGSLDKMPEYADIFEKAYWQAKEFKLNLFSGKPSPLFNYGEYEDTYIPDIAKAVQAQLKDPTLDNPYNGAKVRVRGTVINFANNTLFLQKYDVETDQYYGINVFCGMTKPGGKYLIPGTVLQLCGIAQDSEEFGFQITGAEGHFPEITSLASEDDVQILVKAADNTDKETALHEFTYTSAELERCVNRNDFTALNSGVKVTDPLTVSYFKPNQENKKWTIGFKDASGNRLHFDLYLTVAIAPDPDKPFDTWTTEKQWMGKVIKINYGIYTYHQYTSSSTGEKGYGYQVVINDVSNIELVK